MDRKKQYSTKKHFNDTIMEGCICIILWRITDDFKTAMSEIGGGEINLTIMPGKSK